MSSQINCKKMKSCNKSFDETSSGTIRSASFFTKSIKTRTKNTTILLEYRNTLRTLLLLDSIFLSSVQAGIIARKDDCTVIAVSICSTVLILSLYLLNNSPINNTIRHKFKLAANCLSENLTKCNPNIWTISSLILMISWAVKTYQTLLYFAYCIFILWIFNLDDIKNEKSPEISRSINKRDHNLSSQDISFGTMIERPTYISTNLRNEPNNMEEKILKLSLLYERLEDALTSKIEDLELKLEYDTRQITELHLNLNTVEKKCSTRTQKANSNIGMIRFFRTWTISSTKRFLRNYVLTEKEVKVIKKIHSLLRAQKQTNDSPWNEKIESSSTRISI